MRLSINASQSTVQGVAISPDGRTLATIDRGNQQTIALWNATNGERQQSLQQSGIRGQSVMFSPDGHWLVSTSYEKPLAPNVHVWDLKTGEHHGRFSTRSGSVVFSRDSRQLIVFEQHFSGRRNASLLSVRDIATLQRNREELEGLGNPRAVDLSYDGRTLALAGSLFAEDGSSTSAVVLCDIRDVREKRHWLVLDHAKSTIEHVAFAPDGRSLVTVGRLDGQARIWDPRDGKLRQTITLCEGGHFRIRDVRFMPDSRHIAAGMGNGTVHLLRIKPPPPNVDTEKRLNARIRRPPLGQPQNNAANTSPRVGEPKPTVDSAEITEPQLARSIEIGGRRMAETIAFDRSGKLMLTGGWEYTDGDGDQDIESWRAGKARGVLKLWDPVNGGNIAVFEGSCGAIFDVAFSPDGTLVASVGRVENERRVGEVKIWDVKTRKEKATLAGHTNWVLCVAFSPDGTRMATCGFDKAPKVWDVSTGRLVTTLPEQESIVDVVRFSRDGHVLLSANRRGGVTMWDTRILGGKRREFNVEGFFLLDAAISPGGTLIAVAGAKREGKTAEGGQVRLWDARTLKQLTVFETTETRFKQHGVASSVAFSPDGQLLAATSLGRKVQIWSVKDQREFTTIAHRGTGSGDQILFAPNGMLAFTHHYGVVSLWSVPKWKP